MGQSTSRDPLTGTKIGHYKDWSPPLPTYTPTHTIRVGDIALCDGELCVLVERVDADSIMVARVIVGDLRTVKSTSLVFVFKCVQPNVSMAQWLTVVQPVIDDCKRALLDRELVQATISDRKTARPLLSPRRTTWPVLPTKIKASAQVCADYATAAFLQQHEGIAK